MTQLEQAQADLAFLRGLSISEPAAARRSGEVLVAAGTLFAAASLVNWAGAVGWVPPVAMGGAWWAAMALFYLFAIGVRRRPAGARSVRDRAAGAAWQGMGLAVLAILGGLQLAAWRLRDTAVFASFPTLIFALQAIGWHVAGVMGERRWMRGVAAANLLAAVLVSLLLASPWLYPAYAAALLALLALPGLVLMRSR